MIYWQFVPPNEGQVRERMGSLVSTKFRVPPLDAALVPRPALMALYDRGLACRLTLVAAPAGYGKTTTTALWAHSLRASEQARTQSQPDGPTGDPASEPEQRVAWYALDADDDDYAVFFTRLVTAIEVACPGALAEVPTGLDIVAMPPVHFAARLVDACLRLPCPVVLVLDDFHVITTPEIHSTLAHLIQYAGDPFHLVLVTRHDPVLPIPRLRVQRQVVEVRAYDLRMTAAEASQLLANQLEQPPDAETVTLLLERTEGWVAGLQLAAIALDQDDGDEFVAGFQHNGTQFVTDFLIDEVLERVPDDLREFLLRTALVARFNAEVAARLTGFEVSECRRFLDQLHRRNLFLVVLDREATWFRYHHQFRAMLRNRVTALLTAAEAAAARACAVDWLVEHGWLEEAIAEHVADCNWEAAAGLLEAERHALYNREQWLLMWQRLAQLPTEVVDRRPALLLAKAWVLQTQLRYAAVRALYAQVTALLEASQPAGEALDIVAGEVAALHGSWIYPEVPVEERITHSEAALRRLQPARDYASICGFCYVSLVHHLLPYGRRDEILRRLQHEIHAAGINAGSYLTRLHHALGVLLIWDGSLEALLSVSERYLQLATQYRLTMSIAWANFALGWVHFQQGRAQAAMAALLHVFDLPHRVLIQAGLVSLHALVPVAAELGRLDEAARLVEQLHRHVLDQEAFAVVDEVVALGALVACYRGDRAAAQAWAEAFAAASPGSATAPTSAPMLTGPVAVLPRIALALASEPLLRQAVDLLQRRLAAAQAIHRTTEIMQCAVLLACCCRRLNQPVAALQALEQALALGWPHGYRTVFLEHADDLAPLVQTLVQRRICPEAAALLAAIAAQQARQRPTPLPLVFRPENAAIGLTEREAEILELLAQKLSNKEIAARLHISPITVRNHTTNIFDKLNVASRRQAVAQAQALHLLPASRGV